MSSSLAGKLRAFVFNPHNGPKVYQDLKAADVPVTTAECRSCADPCDQGEPIMIKPYLVTRINIDL